MTDIFTGSLAAFAGPELVIQYPDEVKTGADLDLCFWNVAGCQVLKLRIQAKRLNAAYRGQSRVHEAIRSYHELLHKPPKSKSYQYQTLVEVTQPWVPLYMFYNHQSVADSAHFTSPGPPVKGINLAFGLAIAAELDAKLQAAMATPRRIWHHKRLSHLRKHMFGLDAVLCPSGDWKGANVPTPDVVKHSLSERWTQHAVETARSENGEGVYLKLATPDFLFDASHVDRIPDGPPIRVDCTVERPRITFISGRTDDERTPTISTEC